MDYDVVIVGCGPAGIFSALELTEKTDLKVLMLDRGPDLDRRRCPSSRGVGCVKCNPCALLSGWGGSGAFSDGKLTLSPEVGGWLEDYIKRDELTSFISHVDETYLKFGAPENLYGEDMDRIMEVKRKAAFAGLKLIHEKLRHMGTENCVKVLQRMKKHLENKAEINLNTDVKSLLVKDGSVVGVETSGGKQISAKHVIAAPGRSGAEWFTKEALQRGLKILNNPVDVGVRVEVPAPVMEEVTEAMYEPKFIYYSKSFDDKVRTFCVCPHGEVITESYNDIMTVNGQSYMEKKTNNTNFAVLVSTSFTEPFKDSIAYGKYIARLANLLGGGIIVQRLSDLEEGRRSTKDRIERNPITPTCKSATPGDLSFVLPYRYLADIREMLKAMDQIIPGVHAKHTLLYGVEVKFYSSKLELNRDLETKIHNLFAVGDGAGVTRGLIQASASGLIAARKIIREHQK